MSSRDTARPGAPGAPETDDVDVESGAHVVRVARVVREALEGYASVERVDDMLRQAMAHAGRRALPRAARELQAFVGLYLAPVVEDRLGDDAADALRERLAPMITAMERMETAPPPSGQSPSTLPPPPEAPEVSETLDAPTAERGFAAIVLAGSPQDASRLALRVKMPVQRVADTASFVEAVAGCRGAPRMLVVDCRFQNPITTVGPRVLDHTALDGAVVALWGGNALAEREWGRRFPGAVVLRTDVASDVEDIAVLIRLGPE